MEARLLLARNYLRSLEFETALAHFRAAAALDRGKADRNAIEARSHVGFCLIALGRYAEALAAYRDLLAACSSAHALVMMALMQHRLGRIDEALASYRRFFAAARKDSPETPHALRGAMLALRDRRQYRAADSAAERLLALFAQRPLQVSNAICQRDNSVDFHRWSELADKVMLARIIAEHGGDKTGEPFPYPPSFVLPDDRDRLQRHATETGDGAILSPNRATVSAVRALC